MADRLMTDDELIDYCDAHCETERALFSREQILKMHELAGSPFDALLIPDWMELRDGMKTLVSMARDRRNPKVGLHLAVHTLKPGESIEDFMKTDTFKEFDARCNEYQYQILERAMEGLNIREQEAFWKWYFGKLEGGKTDLKKAENAILWVISMGLG